MQAVFLSCSFRPEDEQLRKQTKSMIEPGPNGTFNTSQCVLA
jgi:hypothetical protein